MRLVCWNCSQRKEAASYCAAPLVQRRIAGAEHYSQRAKANENEAGESPREGKKKGLRRRERWKRCGQRLNTPARSSTKLHIGCYP
uniref:Uncharacterized protein n=1 Tax=Anguilla anguilla TaxID=7936 RepID=A0A0E9TUK7_ANGAN